MNEPTKPCCDVWLKIIGAFGWYKIDDEPDLRLMPYIRHTEAAFRVNNCPSCGASVRGCIVSLKQLDESRMEI